MKKIIQVCIVWAFVVFLGHNFVQAQVPFSFSAGSGTFTPLTSASAFTWNGSSDEGYTNSAPIGFSFNYLGTNYSDFQVSTNGFLRLGTDLASAITANNFIGTTRTIIAPLWDDLKVDSSTLDITYKLDGTTPNQILTVEWKNARWPWNSPLVNAEFQVQLYENNGVIKFIYGNMDTSYLARSASIGLVDATPITVANSAVGKFLSINIGGWDGITGTAVYHQTMGRPFFGIKYPTPDNTELTFTPVTASVIAGGTYTVGGSSPTYNTLSEAAMALNINGIAGPVVLNVRAGTYDDIFHLLAVAGTSVTNTITLKKESGAVTMLPLNGSDATSAPGIVAGDAIIRLDGTKYCTIDGIDLTSNTQTTTNLKFDMGVCLGTPHVNGIQTGGAQYNVIKNLTMDMNATTGVNHAGAIGIRFGTYSGTDTDTNNTNSYNTIQDVNIYDFWRAAVKYFGVSSTNPDRGNKITSVIGRNDFGNVSITSGTGADIRPIEIDVQKDLLIENTDIHDISTSIMTTNGIRSLVFNVAGSTTNICSGHIIVRNNKIYNISSTGAVTTGPVYGIELNVLPRGHRIDIYNNQVYNLLITSTATSGHTSRCQGIMVNLGGTAAIHDSCFAYVYNNMISDIKAPNSSIVCGARGFDLLNGAGKGYFYLHNNSVYLDNSVPPSMIQAASGVNSTCLQGGSFGTGYLELRNNVFVNTMGNSFTGAGFSRAMVLYSGSAALFSQIASTSDNNLYYINNPTKTGQAVRGFHNPGAIGSSSISMTELQNIAGYAPRDANSVSDVVSFVSNNDLHLTGSSIGNGNLAGLPIAGITTDIDGNTRNASYPYKGADEVTTGTFTPKLNITGLIEGFTNPTTGKMIMADTVTVEVRSGATLVDQAKIFVNDMGYGTGSFSSVANGTPYYVVVKHRNSVETWSAATKNFTAYSMNYDFTTDSAKAYGDNMIKVGSKWCFFSGDVNQDGSVDLSDLIEVDNDNANFVTGYVPSDVNGDNNSDLSDMIIVDNNNAAFVGKVTPFILKSEKRINYLLELEKNKTLE